MIDAHSQVMITIAGSSITIICRRNYLFKNYFSADREQQTPSRSLDKN